MNERYAESPATPKKLCQATLKHDPYRDPACGNVCSTPLITDDNNPSGPKWRCPRWKGHHV